MTFKLPSITDLLEELEPGEEAQFDKGQKVTVRRIATRLQKRHAGWRFVCRSTPDDVYHVWRTA